MQTVTTKAWYTSWTVWFNVALLIVTTINGLAQIVPISPTVIAYVAAVGNFLLRFKTLLPVGPATVVSTVTSVPVAKV